MCNIITTQYSEHFGLQSGGQNLFDLVYSNPVIIPPKILRYSDVDKGLPCHVVKYASGY